LYSKDYEVVRFYRTIMKVFVGLGNPGEKYSKNRHNIGFRVLEEMSIIKKIKSWYKKFHAEICEYRLNGEKILLVKPQTYMNNSGQAVCELKSFYKLENTNIIVIHDDLDLIPGKIKVKSSGGHGGHNGLRSIHDFIGSDYIRLRIGIGHPGHKDKVSNYVLSDFSTTDFLWIENVLKQVPLGMDFLLEGKYSRFLNNIALQ
jgi:PTH1 family peptidyl-tRNA hydrolase